MFALLADVPIIYWATGVSVLFCATYRAITGRYKSRAIPWFRVLLKPRKYPDTRELIFNYLGWIAVALTYSCVTTFILTNIPNIGADAGLEKSAEPESIADNIQVILLTVGSFLYFTTMARHYCEKQRVFPKNLLDKKNSELTTPPIEAKPIGDNLHQSITQNLKNSISSVVYLIPQVFAYYYQYFVFDTEHFVNKAAQDLISQNGLATMQSFFKHHIKTRKNENTERLKQMMQEKNVSELATIISLTQTKIEFIGFQAVRRFIDDFVNTPIEYTGPENRENTSPRKILEKPISARVLANGEKHKARISELSQDGSGLFLCTQRELVAGTTILISISDKEIEGLVKHNNRQRVSKKHSMGCGIYIDSQHDKNQLKRIFS